MFFILSCICRCRTTTNYCAAVSFEQMTAPFLPTHPLQDILIHYQTRRCKVHNLRHQKLAERLSRKGTCVATTWPLYLGLCVHKALRQQLVTFLCDIFHSRNTPRTSVKASPGVRRSPGAPTNGTESDQKRESRGGSVGERSIGGRSSASSGRYRGAHCIPPVHIALYYSSLLQEVATSTICMPDNMCSSHATRAAKHGPIAPRASKAARTPDALGGSACGYADNRIGASCSWGKVNPCTRAATDYTCRK